jgi:hypothetical protein
MRHVFLVESADDADGRRWKRDKQTRAAIGAAMTVDNELGHGFLESVHHETLEREVVEPAIPYKRVTEFPGARASITGAWSSICAHLFRLRIIRPILVG